MYGSCAEVDPSVWCASLPVCLFFLQHHNMRHARTQSGAVGGSLASGSDRCVFAAFFCICLIFGLINGVKLLSVNCSFFSILPCGRLRVPPIALLISSARRARPGPVIFFGANRRKCICRNDSAFPPLFLVDAHVLMPHPLNTLQ